MKTQVHIKTYTQMFIAVLLKITPNWKPKHPSMGESTTNSGISYNGIPHLAIKNNMSESQRLYTERSQSPDVISSMILCVTFGKRQIYRDRETISVCQELVWGEGLTTKG